MSFAFGKTSLERLGTCDPRLEDVARRALETSPMDFGIACGHRGKEDQEKAVAEGKSKVHWPNGKHNAVPSKAFDFFPVVNGKADWDDIKKFKTIALHILKTGEAMGVKLRWGGDWNCNCIEDDNWYDRPHIELKE